MNLGEVLDVFNLVIADKAPDSEDMTPERFTTLLQYANRKHFIAAVDKKKWDSLRPFTVILGENGTMALPVSEDGTATLPSDYVDHISSRHQYLKGTEVKHTPVREVDNEKYDYMLSSHVEKPTKRYPILNIQEDHLRVAPKNLRYIIFTYVGDTNDPVYGVSYYEGFPQYDASQSTELLWNDENILDIIFIMAKEFGAIVTIEQVQQAAAQKSKK